MISSTHTHTYIHTQLQSQKLVKHRENSFSSFIFERRADLGCILRKKWEILFSLPVIRFIFVQLCWTLYFRSLPLLHLSLPWFQVSRQIWKKPITPCGLSIYKHFDTEWGVHFRAPKDDLQLAAAVVFQPDFWAVG